MSKRKAEEIKNSQKKEKIIEMSSSEFLKTKIKIGDKSA